MDAAGEMTITLAEYADRVLTPAILQMAGLPDTPVGRDALDKVIDAMIADTAEGWDD